MIKQQYMPVRKFYQKNKRVDKGNTKKKSLSYIGRFFVNTQNIHAINVRNFRNPERANRF